MSAPVYASLTAEATKIAKCCGFPLLVDAPNGWNCEKCGAEEVVTFLQMMKWYFSSQRKAHTKAKP